MKTNVYGALRNLEIVAIPHGMKHDEIIKFLAGKNMAAGTEEDLSSYLNDHPQDIVGKYVWCITSTRNGAHITCDGSTTVPLEEKFDLKQALTVYPEGCCFIAVHITKKEIKVGGEVRIAEIVPFDRWMYKKDVEHFFGVTRLKLGSLEDVKAYFEQNPGELGRKWESDGVYEFILDADFYTATAVEAGIKHSDGWCATIIIHPTK